MGIQLQSWGGWAQISSGWWFAAFREGSAWLATWLACHVSGNSTQSRVTASGSWGQVPRLLGSRNGILWGNVLCFFVSLVYNAGTCRKLALANASLGVVYSMHVEGVGPSFFFDAIL